MSGFTDIHNHFVYGVDDGPKTYEQMTDMLDAAAADGISHIIATPHITPGVEQFEYDTFYRHLLEAQEYCHEAQLPLTLHPGSEVFYTPHTGRYLAEGRIPTLAGTRYVLVEFSPQVPLEELRQALQTILRNSHIPIVAHVERYQCLVKNLKAAKQLKESIEVRFQLNASTVIKGKGFWIERFVKHMLEEGYIDYIATDAHNTTNRPAAIQAAYNILRDACGDEAAIKLVGLNGIGLA